MVIPEIVCWAVATVAAGLCVFAAGYAAGVRVERDGWVLRGRPSRFGRTAHHADGEFWAVLPEREFVEQWCRRRLVPPSGGSGTLPPQSPAGVVLSTVIPRPKPGGDFRYN